MPRQQFIYFHVAVVNKFSVSVWCKMWRENQIHLHMCWTQNITERTNIATSVVLQHSSNISSKCVELWTLFIRIEIYN